MEELAFILLIGPVILIIQLIFFIKIWIACNEIVRIKKMNSEILELNQDTHYWKRVQYESDKRRGVITSQDMDAADRFING